MAVVFNSNVANAATELPDGKRPEYHFNQNFNDLPASYFVLNGTDETTWRGRQASGKGLFFWAGNPQYDAVSGRYRLQGNGSGNRNAELLFPTPQANPDFPQDKPIIIEFDWDYKASTDYLHPNLLYIGGSNSVSVQNTAAADHLKALILGIYTFGDGYFYCWNIDQNGPDEVFGPVFAATGGFTRRGDDAATTAEYNAPNVMIIPAINGTTYHIRAELDFATQKVLSLTLSYTDDTETLVFQNLTDLDFLAKTTAAADVIAAGTNIVNDLALIGGLGTKVSGNNSDFDYYIDNMEVYALAESDGSADVTVQYLDQDGNAVKPSRVVEGHFVNTPYALIASDKDRFQDDNYYYSYNAEATIAANQAVGSVDGESINVPAGGVTLTVVFQKTAITNGTYVWTGAAGNGIWSEIDANFSVNGGAAIAYQEGNSVLFPAALAGDIVLKGAFTIGTADVTVEGDYVFSNYESGVNYLLGDSASQFIIADGNVTLGFDCRVPETAVYADSITITNSATAKKIIFKKPQAKLIQKTNTDLGIALEFDPEILDGTLDIDVINSVYHTMSYTNVANMNVNLYVRGKHNTNWSTAFRPSGSFGPMKINVHNKITELIYNADSTAQFIPIAGFGITDAPAAQAWINLGENTRLVRDYNENKNNNSVTQVGVITGGPTTEIAQSFIGGRRGRLQINGIEGLESKFEGRFTNYYDAGKPETLTEGNKKGVLVMADAKAIFTNDDYALEGGIEVGAAGKLSVEGENITLNDNVTLAGELEFQNDVFMIDSCATTINNGGKLLLGGSYLIYAEGQSDRLSSPANINVNEGGLLKVNKRGSVINTYNLMANAGSVLEGDINVPVSLNMSLGTEEIAPATWKATVSSFTDGDYDKLVANTGDLNLAGNMDITVLSSTKGAKIMLLGGAAIDAVEENVAFGKVTVNGIDITAFNESTPEAEYLWMDANAAADFYNLVSLTDKAVSLEEVDNSGKEVKTVQYYDITGSAVSQDATGFVIEKVIYTDGTSSAKKTFVPVK